MTRSLTILFSLSVLTGCFSSSPHGDPTVIPAVDLKRYSGCWYEIASIPMVFQRGCVATTARYEVKDASTLTVHNRCRSERFDGDVREVQGEASVHDPAEPTKLDVHFDTWWGIFARGRYWIVRLDPQYQYSVVSGPNRKRLWILSRTPAMSDEQYQAIVTDLAADHFPVAELVRTPQPEHGECQ